MIGAVFLDPVAPLLVIGGAAAMAAVRSTGEDCRRALGALRRLVAARPAAEAQAARVAISHIVERAIVSGPATVDRAPVVERFLARAAAMLADAPDRESFRRWGEAEIADRAARHAAAQAVWRAAADAAPGMGMIGTVLGLIGMFARMDDAAAIGPGMALALATTLWGMLIAQCVAGPVAARLERLGEAEIDWQARAVARLAELAPETSPLAGIEPLAPRRRLRPVA